MQPERIDRFEWRIPVGTVPGMRVPGIVFATDELMDKAVEDRDGGYEATVFFDV